ncbi:hypothetical protein [Xenorhabdus entomophaga]|uniref:hypothetical protein n=1 Tax=Xenorhabdus entomophaga TaxID=3136257 RepID=UPI0030F4722A
MKETNVIKKIDVVLNGDETLLPYWIVVRAKELENNHPYIFRDGLSDEDLYYWLRYQADRLKEYIDAKNRKAAELMRLQGTERFIENNQSVVDQEKFCFPHGSILQGESLQR